MWLCGEKWNVDRGKMGRKRAREKSCSLSFRGRPAPTAASMFSLLSSEPFLSLSLFLLVFSPPQFPRRVQTREQDGHPILVGQEWRDAQTKKQTSDNDQRAARANKKLRAGKGMRDGRRSINLRRRRRSSPLLTHSSGPGCCTSPPSTRLPSPPGHRCAAPWRRADRERESRERRAL